MTGSIGVIGVIPNFQQLGNDFGVTWDGVSTSRFADSLTVSRPKTEAELLIFKKFIDSAYDDFLSRVAEGRNLPLEEVKAIAGGRVWSGAQALEHKLVDEIGGLLDTINAVAKEATLVGDYHILEYPGFKSFSEKLEEMLESKNEQPALARLGQTALPFTKYLREMEILVRGLDDPMGVYARLPWFLELD